jgi:hypothetical protein
MATTNLNTRHRRSQPRSRASVMPMSERQLDAYLLARDTLRRVRAVASMFPGIANDSSPPASQA